MKKDYIESLLREEEIVLQISKLRTQFSHHITEFYFFKTFIEVLKLLNINCLVFDDATFEPESGKFIVSSFIELQENNNILRSSKFKRTDFVNILRKYNTDQCEMSLRESTHALIDIFIGLL